MSNYQVPQVTISQEFAQLPIFSASPLSALIIGPAFPAVANPSVVTGLTLTAGGTLYTVTPTVTITRHSGDTTGAGATATATLGTGANSGKVVSLTLTAPGANYTLPPDVTINRGNGDTTGGSATATATISTRAFSASQSGAIGSVTDDASIIALFGDINPANTLAYGLHCAINNSNGAVVYYGAVPTNDEAGYTSVLDLAEKGTYYGIVPLTNDTSIQADVIGHVNAMSAKDKAKWRTCWLSTNVPSGTYANSAAMATAYVEALLHGGTEGEGSNANAGPRRIHNVFPDVWYVDTTTSNPLAGYFLAASLAGLRSGSVPHRSLTNTEVVGPVNMPRVLSDFTSDDLDTIAAAGVWIITQNSKGGGAYTRHQLTADTSNLNYSEDSITANVDSISYGLQAALEPYVGIYNITPATVLKIRAAVDGELSYRLTQTYTEVTGNQLLGYKIINISQDPTFQDRINVTVSLDVPYPLNNVIVTLSI